MHEGTSNGTHGTISGLFSHHGWKILAAEWNPEGTFGLAPTAGFVDILLIFVDIGNNR
jgi:hypothetical protein